MKKVTLETFAHNLQLHMQKKGLAGYQDLARELNIEKEKELRVKRWLDGSCFPQHKMMVAILRYFNIQDYCQLLTEKVNVDQLITSKN